MIDITGFPHTTDNNLDWITYMKYHKIIENMTRSQEKDFDKFICEKHNIRRSNE